MTFRLRVLRGRDLGTEFALGDGQEAVIGRGLDCTLRLADPTVSRRHCRIAVQDGQATLYDDDSRWGTLVNGEATRCHQLEPGDRITVGETELQFQLEPLADAPTLAKPDDRHEKPGPRQVIDASWEAIGTPSQGGAGEAAPEAACGNCPAPSPPTPLPQAGEGSPGGRAHGARDPVSDLGQLAGTRFARFQVESVVARAQTGVVFRASDVEQSRTVALKVFYPENFQDARNMRRFLRAARTMVPIQHENLVALYRAGRSRGLCYTVCEFVEGESAVQVIDRIGISGMLPWQHAFRIAVHVARALEVAERHGIIHRNITPRNILIRSSDRVAKLGDLVLAKAMEGTRQEQITRPGELVGQLEYLSPEQTTGARPPDTRSDLYSLGATLYAVLTGRPPFEGRSPVETILKIQTEEPVKPTKYHLSIPPLLDDVVLRMLAKRPDDRIQTATKLLKSLYQVAKYQGLCVDDLA
jgi:pSer/pThr/pTyr-binding forkhead associated (FHA) protein